MPIDFRICKGFCLPPQLLRTAFPQLINAGFNKFQNSIGLIMNDMPGIVNSLGPRGPVGSAQNYQRSAAVGQALHANKGKYKS